MPDLPDIAWGLDVLTRIIKIVRGGSAVEFLDGDS